MFYTLLGLGVFINQLCKAQFKIEALPSAKNPVLILSQQDERIDYFDVRFVAKVSTPDGLANQMVAKYQLWDLNYIWLTEDVLFNSPNEINIEIDAISKEDGIIGQVTAPYLDSNQPVISGEAYCIAPDYAYRVSYGKWADGRGRVAAMEGGLELYAYMWYTQSYLENQSANQNPIVVPYYNESFAGINGKLELLYDPSSFSHSHQMRDYNGFQISAHPNEVIYGVPKRMGPWGNSYTYCVADNIPYLNIIDPTDPLNVEQFLWYLNNPLLSNIENLGIPDFSCQGLLDLEWDHTGGGYNGTDYIEEKLPKEDDGDQGGDSGNDNRPKPPVFEDTVPGPQDPAGGGWGIGSAGSGEVFYNYLWRMINSTKHPNGKTWTTSDILSINVQGFRDTGSESVLSTFPNSTGPFSLPDFELDKGMYKVFVQLKGKLIWYYFGVKDPMKVNFTMAQLFNAVVFPNPMTGVDYNIHMNSLADLNVQYELIDNQLQTYYRTKYIIGSGHDETHVVNDAGVIPDGLLFHKFTFEDGSFKVVQAIKQP